MTCSKRSSHFYALMLFKAWGVSELPIRLCLLRAKRASSAFPASFCLPLHRKVFTQTPMSWHKVQPGLDPCHGCRAQTHSSALLGTESISSTSSKC